MPSDRPPISPPPDWYEDAFGDLYNVIYAHRTVEAAAPEAAFAVQVLKLTSHDRVLDLCCGSGRHLVHLAKVAGCAVGLDYSRPLLLQGRGLLGPRTRLVRADMRAVPFDAAFDAVTNFFTSFGYFLDDADNMQVISEMARALKPGGRFFIDYVNPAHVRDTLEPESRRVSGRYEIAEKRWIDEATHRINKRITVRTNGVDTYRFFESVRLYSEQEMRSLLPIAGLQIQRIFGGYCDAQGPLPERMILVGCRCR
ncbi:MAG: class I SAM-dependent methyltransferase [Candidatus Hydrogenedentes bacterium]|nr:class I SAM-dependent methyltransferase [Candidatus Hydrogenedentota bacterium]